MGKIKKAFEVFGLDKGLKNFFKEIFSYLAWKKSVEKKRRNIQKKGILIIKKVQETLSQNGVFFFFDMGTLLGIIREGGFIKHDLDIDIAVRVDSEDEKLRIKEIFSSVGAEECFRYTAEGLGIVEQSFSYMDVKFDINYYITKGDNDYCYLMYRHPDKEYEGDDMSVVELSCAHVVNTELHKLYNIDVNVPENPEAYLANRYGETWRIPDKGYVYWKGPSTAPTEYIGKKIEL